MHTDEGVEVAENSSKIYSSADELNKVKEVKLSLFLVEATYLTPTTFLLLVKYSLVKSFIVTTSIRTGMSIA